MSGIEREAMEYDVVIVGAGPAGLSAAIRLKQLDAAEGSLHEALRQADAAGDDDTRVRAWIRLLRLVGYQRRDFEASDRVAADARAAPGVVDDDEAQQAGGRVVDRDHLFHLGLLHGRQQVHLHCSFAGREAGLAPAG